MRWLRENSEVIEALGTLLTAFVAAAALIGVKIQIDSSAKVAEAQSAREIYRDFLELSIANPDLADPGQCPAFTPARSIAYTYYLEYMLYTAEQVTQMDAEWQSTFDNTFEEHLDALCASNDWSG